MLKHTEILNSMSAKQKISLITNINCLADDEYAALGIPRVKIVTLDELFAKEGDGLTPYTLARSWNTDLITKVTEEIVKHNCADANIIIVPSPKINLGAEGEVALSEDPLLSSEIALAFISAVKSCGKSCIIPDFYLTKKEVANLDLEPNKKALNDFFFEPFSKVARRGELQAVIGSISKNDGAYEDFNRTLVRSKSSYFSEKTDILCLCKTYDETIAALDEDCIIFTGVEIAIQNAYDQYLSLRSSIEKGRASMLSLEEAFEHKTAISDQMLDDAVEKIIDFAYRINKIDPNPQEEPAAESTNEESAVVASEKDAPEAQSETEGTPGNNEAEPIKAEDAPKSNEAEPLEIEVAPVRDEAYEFLLTKAIEKSIVMLKNQDNILPFTKAVPYAIIGDVAMTAEKNGDKSFADYFAESLGGKCIGTDRGYDALEDRSDSLIPSAVALASKADTVFVFLKPHDYRATAYPCTALPANQTALINALAKCKCKIVVIISGDMNVNVSFHNLTAGLVLAPIAGKLSAQALASVISGKTSMGGKLTASFYVSPNKFFKKQRFYKDNNRNKISIFTGYRFYDTQNITISYPFGFGLKYSKVEITNARCLSDTLTFTVTNRGSRDIDETIEIYTGVTMSKLVRPDKELKAFHTLRLKPGKSEQISIKKIDFSTYDETSGTKIVESGQYTVYIGTSVSNIETSVSTTVRGKALGGVSPNLSEYLQSKTNIISNNFTLEAKHNKMANYKSLRNAGLFCLLVSIIVALMSISTDYPLIPLITGGVILLASVALLITSFNLHTRVRREETELIKKNKEIFENADSAATEKLENLFMEEFKFDITDSVTTAADVEEVYTDSSTAMFNDSMTFTIAAADLKKSATESGTVIDDHLAASIMSSLISSRLIFAKTDDTDKFDSFVESVANYFGASLFTEEITDAHLPQDRLLKVTAEDGTSTSTAVMSALLSAEEKPQVMHIVHLKNLKTEKISECLIPYIKYLSNPSAKAEISPKGSDEVYNIPSNVWFITAIEKGALVESIPAYVLEHATVLPVKYTECMPAETRSEIVPITLTDFEFLTERSKSKYMLSEDVWKKIDVIEEFTFKHSSYKIGNKLWLRIETCIATLLSMNIELPTAIDTALATIVLPTLASVLAGKIEENDKSLIDEIERVFGEENVQISHEMIVSKA